MLGADGTWSNVDSRVATTLHTLINAEGDLAARTDPQWVAALARHGFTLDEDGDVAELAGVVRPFSRRSGQIEANRAKLVAQWSVERGGPNPSIRVLTQIDRRAWAMSRPNKPANLDEQTWEATVRDELASLNARLALDRAQVPLVSTPLDTLDGIVLRTPRSLMRTSGPPASTADSVVRSPRRRRARSLTQRRDRAPG